MLTDIQITTVREILSNFNPDVSEDQALQDLTGLFLQFNQEVVLPVQKDRYVQQLAALSVSNPAAFARVQAVIGPAMREKVQTAVSVINPPVKVK